MRSIHKDIQGKGAWCENVIHHVNQVQSAQMGIASKFMNPIIGHLEKL